MTFKYNLKTKLILSKKSWFISMKYGPMSLRTKIVLSFLLVIMVGGIISLSVGARLIKDTIISQAQIKVMHDLHSARMVFDEKLNDIKDIVTLTAAREGIQEDIKNNKQDVLTKKFTRIREKHKLDILTLTDPRGIVIVRTRNQDLVGDDQSQDEIIKRALKKSIVAKPQILPHEELLKEDKVLAEQAFIKFVTTPMAEDRVEDKETSGMMLKAASPIIDEGNNLLGVLYGGILLNRNYEIVDRIKEIVYKGEQYKGREIGTATIFQNDLRISTNVKNEKNERAIGTRVSKEVNHAVLKEGKPWIDRAFVVNEWYITAYEPIRNIDDKIIGILYVGLLESPYIQKARHVLLAFALLSVLWVILLLIILYLSTTKIINPLREMVTATQRIAKGDLFQKVKVPSKDEIGILADSFNQMTRNLKVANEKLIEWGKSLEIKVKKRTNELVKMQEQLIQSEKLASLGKLSASIAHEINNPLGAILVYGHLLLEETDKNDAHYKNINKIIKETSRCKDIIRSLLEFARPGELEKHSADVNEIVEKSLTVMKQQLNFQNLRLNKNFSPTLPKIKADSIKMQQVFINIIRNAAEAMDGKGLLTIRTFLTERGKYICIKFSDTGTGIKEEDKNRIFEPFFSTKDVGKGTGLGLAISYSIVEQHRGKIEVESKVGKGSSFAVKIPISMDE